ncbi:hypothetical protein L1987_12019 [Smallanthus sonchifolius]|uniref:Uncharacterized protein n=1 Tax=Smallanthus sonchifolius TaxID=185202 RepID=A0ACB9JER7_9ASTR|nr:hypothetical protein L1987_12019 [Smallanthus sonchifolius]
MILKSCKRNKWSGPEGTNLFATPYLGSISSSDDGTVWDWKHGRRTGRGSGGDDEREEYQQQKELHVLEILLGEMEIKMCLGLEARVFWVGGGGTMVIMVVARVAEGCFRRTGGGSGGDDESEE